MKLRTELINEWVRLADVDYNSAKNLLKAEDDVIESICYHSQQVVEKYFKTFLVCKEILFEKIHNLNTLLIEIEKFTGEDIELRELIKGLNEYGVAIKYPSAHVSAKRDDAVIAFEKAKKIRAIMLHRIENMIIEIEKNDDIK